MTKINRTTELSTESLFDRANDAWDHGKNKLALSLFLKATESGDPRAFNTTGYFFDHGIGARKDPSRALAWYKKAARHGDVCAYANIGLSYKNDGKRHLAKKWLEKARDAGDDGAAVDLAKLLLEQPNRSNSAAATKCLKMALKSNSIDEESREEAIKLLSTLEDSKP